MTDLDIINLNLLKITKVKDWNILFDYDGKHYMLHEGFDTDDFVGYGILYERFLDDCGRYKLKYLKEGYGNNLASVFIRSKFERKNFRWVSSMTYSQIDKKFFVNKLIKHKFIKSATVVE